MTNARKWTDKELKALERKISRVYKEALSDITGKFTSFFLSAENALASLQAEYDAAKASGNAEAAASAAKKLADKKRSVTLLSDRYQIMIDETTRKIADANEIAIAFANNELPKVYVKNYNEASVVADEIGIDFSLTNERAVKNLILEGDIRLPYKKLSVPKDQRWNTKKLNSAVLQGLLQGESMQTIARRILPIVGDNKDAAIRNARTMVTGAENRGKMDSYISLEDKGAVIKKVWIATPDERTRQSHLDLDGIEVSLQDKFPNGLMYPGDPEGDPGEVYNCRCALISKVVGFRKADGRIEPVDIDAESALHRKQIEQEKEARRIEAEKKEQQSQSQSQKTPDKVITKDDIKIDALEKTIGKDEYDRYLDLVVGSPYDGAYAIYGNELSGVTRRKGGGVFRSSSKTIEFDYVNRPGMSRYSTLAHELSHFYDYEIDTDGLGITFVEVDRINQLSAGRAQNITKRTISQCDSFLAALRLDMENPSVTDAYREKNFDAFAGVMDACDGFFSQKKLGLNGWGHGDAYYDRRYKIAQMYGKDADLVVAYQDLGVVDVKTKTAAKKRCRQYDAASEAWANIGSALVCGGDELAAAEKYLPNATAEMRRLLEEVKRRK